MRPANAYANGGGFARNVNGAGDRHRYYDYGISIPEGCAVAGIQVRLDWRLDSVNGANSMSAALSWNGGGSWTALKTDGQETTTQHQGLLGGASDTWGRGWTASDLGDANFRVRLTSNCSGSRCGQRDYSLDWVPVKVFFQPGPAPTSTPTATATSTPSVTPTATVTRTATPTPSAFCGDVTGDGQVTYADVVAEIQALMFGSQNPRYDVNHDGRVTVADLRIVIQQVGTRCQAG